MRNSPRASLRLALTMALVTSTVAIGAAPAAAQEPAAVFSISNAADGNEVLVFARAGDGTLTHVDSVGAGGLGSGGGLGSQGAATLSDDGNWLFAVNAGSNSVSAFAVDGTDITLADTAASRGESPISVATHGDIVYVVNAGSSNVSGYRFDDGDLEPIPAGVQSLSSDEVGPAQVEFSPDGRSLVVTEKATNRLSIFRVGASGQISPARVSESAGETPFGFEFAPDGTLVVSEAFGGAPGASTVTAYDVGANRVATGVSTAANLQSAACWLAISDDGGHVYVTNTGSATVSHFTLDADGSLTLVSDTATGASPIDLDLSDDGAHLYVVNGRSDSISVYSVAHDGSLTLIQTVEGIPASTVGIAAG